LISFIISLALSVPLDSFFWQRLLWPEFSSLLFNVYSGKSTEWGVSPWHSYFSSFLPKLLLNPLIIPLIAYSLYLPATRKLATGLAVPSLSFVALYSIQPHKEARFIIYVVPALLGAAALSANYIWTRRAKSLVYKIASIALLGSTALSAAASTGMLFISALNYPGGEALWLLHQLAAQDGKTGEVNVHLDVLSCMTGVSRFMQDSPSPPIWGALPLPIPVPTPSSSSSSSPVNANKEPLVWHYDKTEDSPALLDPSFWSAFDYILTSSPSSVPGTWEVVRTVYGLAGMEILRPGQNVYTVDNSVILGRAKEALRLLTNRAFLEDVEVKGQGSDEVLMDEVGIYGILKETVRRFVTGGWWVGPRMEEKIWILKRVY
jgi:alpha-1,6-mannosyltransferase